jgi:DNA-binding NarL/FixJ family response regulator
MPKLIPLRQPDKDMDHQGRSGVRVLVVEDNEPFRRYFCSTLEQRAGFRVIGQASDGLEAVQKAAELQPDLILLDISLPQLNGIEVAKRIRKLASRSQILFVSQETSSDIVEAAFSLGALGYVYKSRIHADLLPAIESVLTGRLFVSASLETHQATDETNVGAPVRHEALFYSEDAVLVNRVAGFIAPALRSDNPAIVVATESHREALTRRLKEDGLDLEGAIQKGKYISLDATETLSRLLVNGSIDRVRFINHATELLKSASNAMNNRRPRIALFGEGVGLLWAEGNTDAARNIEEVWNALLRTHGHVDLLCAFSLSAFYGEARKDVYESICKEHSAVHVQ